MTGSKAWPRTVVPATSVLAAWLVPVLAHLAHADAVVPVLVWLVTASLLRGRTTLVDRLVIAFAVLIGAVCVAGLLFSVWPPHLAPVAVGGASLTVLALVSAVTGRRPRLPSPVLAWRDLPVVLVGAVAALVAWAPVAGRDATGRLAVMFTGEDLSRHFMIFDWMRRTGGYLFTSGTVGDRLDADFRVYPQGSHLVAAVLEQFRHPSGSLDVYTSFHDYVDYTLGAYVFFAVVIAWSLSWVWAARQSAAWAVVSYTVLATAVCFGSFLTMITRGYPSQLTGLGLLVALIALAARPIREGAGTEQLVLLGILFVGLSFVYYFYLPLALLAIVAWALPWRGRVGPTVAIAVPVVILAAVMPLVNIGTGTLSILTYGGPAVGPPARWLGILTILAALVTVGTGHPLRWPLWTDPVRRTLMIVMVGTIAFITGLVVLRYAMGTGVVYYVKKGLYALLIVDLILLGGLGATARELAGDRMDRTWPAWLRRVAAPVAAIAVAVLILAGARVLDPAPARGLGIFLPVPATGTNYGRAYAAGRLAVPEQADAAVRAARAAGGTPDGRLVLFWDSYGRGWDFYAAQWANVLNRRLDAATMAAMVQIPRERRSGDELEKLLDSVDAEAGPATPVLLVTREDATGARVAAYRAAHPRADIRVLRLPGTCGDRCLR